MWRLYKNKQNKFEISFVTKQGEFIVGSKQGYENRKDAVDSIRLVGRGDDFQDETRLNPVRYYICNPFTAAYIKMNGHTVAPYKKRFIKNKQNKK